MKSLIRCGGWRTRAWWPHFPGRIASQREVTRAWISDRWKQPIIPRGYRVRLLSRTTKTFSAAQADLQNVSLQLTTRECEKRRRRSWAAEWETRPTQTRGIGEGPARMCPERRWPPWWRRHNWAQQTPPESFKRPAARLQRVKPPVWMMILASQ